MKYNQLFPICLLLLAVTFSYVLASEVTPGTEEPTPTPEITTSEEVTPTPTR